MTFSAPRFSTLLVCCKFIDVFFYFNFYFLFYNLNNFLFYNFHNFFFNLSVYIYNFFCSSYVF